MGTFLNGERAGVRGECARRGSKCAIAATCAFALFLAFLAPARGAVLPPDVIVDGKTIGEWGAEFWKWAFSISTNHHPLIDEAGTNAHRGHLDASVFMLGGTFGSAPPVIARTVTVPEGKYVFLPILNVYAGDPGDPPTVEGRLDAAAAFIDGITNIYASLDGVAVPDLWSRRAVGPVFSFEFPSCDNLMSVNNQRCISGLADNLVTDGYWLMIEPLPVGQHILNFGGSYGPPFNFSSSDLTYTITVVPRPLSQQVADLMATVAGTDIPRKHQRPLQATLRGAAKSFAKDHLKTGIRHLRAFQKKVRHELGRRDPALAEQLIQAAQQIIDQAEQNSDKIHSKGRPKP